MVQITDKPQHDPVADLKTVDAYMRWALEAAEEVVGKQGLAIVLRDNGLERFIDNYPPDHLDAQTGVTLGDYTNLSSGLLRFYGRPGKSMVLRVGRLSAQKGIKHQSGVFNLATVLAAKLLPSGTQIKMGLAAMEDGFRKIYATLGQEWHGRIEDRGDKWAWIVETCPVCAGKQADGPICWLLEGLIEESARQVFGKFFDVTETECRANGAPACVFEVPKKPTEDKTP